MQALAENPDVQAVADAADIPGALGTIAALIRDHDGRDPSRFDRALDGAYGILYTLIDAATTGDDQRDADEEDEIAERVEAVVQAMRTMYANATDPKDLGKRRGKALELFVYRRIAGMYETNDCQMDCCVLGENAHYDNLAGREFDVCAWDETRFMGEAYECAVKPYGLVHRDCQALVILSMAVQEEYADAGSEPWFRIGLVSFDRSKFMLSYVRNLAKTQTEQVQFAKIDVYGWDNLDKITQ